MIKLSKEKEKKKKYLKHIAVLLKRRKSLGCSNYMSLRTLPLAIFCFVAGVLFSLLVIFVSISEGLLWALAGFVPLLCFFGGVMIIVVAKKTREEIYLWLDDMTECPAKAKTERSHLNLFPFDNNFLTTDCLIKIEFDYQEEKITKYAEGTKSIFTKYVGQYSNREIRILYSPKYDQILILKDNAPIWKK